MSVAQNLLWIVPTFSILGIIGSCQSWNVPENKYTVGQNRVWKLERAKMGTEVCGDAQKYLEKNSLGGTGTQTVSYGPHICINWPAFSYENPMCQRQPSPVSFPTVEFLRNIFFLVPW